MSEKIYKIHKYILFELDIENYKWGRKDFSIQTIRYVKII